METVLTKTIISGALTLLLIVSGVWLRKNGEPYKTDIFTIHKLAIVALVVFVVLIYINHLKTFSFNGTGFILFIISDVIFLVAFISGALLSFEKIVSYQLKIVHRLVSWITILFVPVIWLVCH
ncbi:hypothetical protein GM418_28520 [Maribellus comscasis]|uniref:Cytochrome b561 domain-containing protein n=1 Tax=Maribellus comscasis TaxID=2681766 RepID=A0A6I6K4Z1_9BACT|nr:hypothetical protein [Maribellus comscasis]QGY47472.1 hypothetical protein GM418_28520 [Maribellus comscasis]